MLPLAVVVIATIQEEPCGKGHQHGRHIVGVVSSTLAGRSTTVAAVAHMEYHRNETLGTVTTTQHYSEGCRSKPDATLSLDTTVADGLRCTLATQRSLVPIDFGRRHVSTLLS